MVNQGLLQTGFIEVLIGGKIQELQHIRVFDDLLIFRFRLRGLYFRRDALLVPAGENSLIEQGVDLSLQLADAPSRLDSFLDIKTSWPSRPAPASKFGSVTSSIRYAVWSELGM